jgi:hypothetical protein
VVIESAAPFGASCLGRQIPRWRFQNLMTSPPKSKPDSRSSSVTTPPRVVLSCSRRPEAARRSSQSRSAAKVTQQLKVPGLALISCSIVIENPGGTIDPFFAKGTGRRIGSPRKNTTLSWSGVLARGLNRPRRHF